MRSVRSPMLPLDARGPYARGAGGWPWLALARRAAGEDEPAATPHPLGAAIPRAWTQLHRIFLEAGR